MAASETQSGVRRHHLISEEELGNAIEVGGQIVASVPGEGYVVSVPAGAIELPEVDPDSKLSPDLNLSGVEKRTVVVEFFPDVAADEQESSALSAGAELHQHPDLTPAQLLVDASPESVRALSRRDEIAYIFPASEELQRGEPVLACLNSVAGTPGAGQYVVTVGDGWDGPGPGNAKLTYSWQHLTDKVAEETVKALITRALDEWSKYVRIQFTYTDAISARRNLNILFGSRAHGDEFPFDGRGRVLAHTYFPNPPNPEPVAGDLHLDADESWQNGADIDVFSVVLHELGHALGLGHSDRPTAVMYPYYKRVTGLAAEDAAAIRRLYAEAAAPEIAPPLRVDAVLTRRVASPTADLSGTTSGGTGEVRVTWSDDRGHSGTAEGSRTWRVPAVALNTGVNTFRISARDAAGTEAAVSVSVTRTAAVPPQIRLSSSGSAGTGAYSGTASHPSGIREVQWSNSAGGSGTANGTGTWTARVELKDGVNNLRFTAIAMDGSQGSLSLAVTLGAPDRTNPSIVVLTPSGTSVSTREATLRITGSAADNVAVAHVRWSTSTGESGTASGTTSWSIDAVPLAVGQNILTVRAFDAAGNSGWRTIAITRQR